MDNVTPTRSEGTLSGLTEPEAKAFHRVFTTSFLVYVAIAAVAHVLAWMWRPWGI
ncbi:MAG: light-harvesting antenna LH1, beta subunit [Gemmatimonadota bacterium]|jgi:light-harvesting complex 1 beta chain